MSHYSHHRARKSIAEQALIEAADQSALALARVRLPGVDPTTGQPWDAARLRHWADRLEVFTEASGWLGTLADAVEAGSTERDVLLAELRVRITAILAGSYERDPGFSVAISRVLSVLAEVEAAHAR